MFDEKVIEEIASSNDIVDVISSYIPLKREGKNYSALCPFHREKTPSFKVFPDSQRFKCFGCGKSGNVFLFVMEMEKLTFPESMEFLARAAGITLEKTGRTSGRNIREICFKLNHIAHEYFRKSIKSDAGKVVTAYILDRGFTASLSRDFGLGYSLPGWTGLLDFARKKGVDPKDLVDAGLALSKERGRYYDRFRNRLMFPILDVQGRICGFGARSIDGTEPKYLNSPETPVFSKSKMLFGLHKGRETLSRTNTALLMEGYTDVMAAHQAGIFNACATLGTALTREHLRLLKRFVKEVILVFDGDSAGIKAVERSLPLLTSEDAEASPTSYEQPSSYYSSQLPVLISEDIEARIVVLPKGSDPLDFISSNGADALRKLVSNAEPLFKFLFSQLEKETDLSNPSSRITAANRIASLLAQVDDRLRRDVWLSEAAEFLKLNPDLLRRTVAQSAKRGYSGRGRDDSATAKATEKRIGSPGFLLVGALLAMPELLDEYASKFEDLSSFSRKSAIFVEKFLQIRQKEEKWDRVFWKVCSDGEEFALAEQLKDKAPENIIKARAVIDMCLDDIEQRSLRERIAQVKNRIVEAQNEGDDWAVECLSHELTELNRRLKR